MSARKTQEHRSPHDQLAEAAQAAPRDWRTNQTAFPRAPEVGPQPPYRYLGGSLGLCDDSPIVLFSSPDGKRFEGDAAVVLRHVDLFAEPDRSRILFDMGMQYGLDPWQMVDPNHKAGENT